MPELTWRRPWLYPKQYDAIYDPARYSIIEASTKSGKTVGCLVWLIEKAMQGKEGQNYWWVAPVYPQSKIAYRRAKRGLDQDLYKANEGELTITLVNGAVIWFKSAEKADNLYGEDVYAVVLEEATRMRADAWHAARSTITATRAPVRIIGNVKGKKNWVYKMARRAEQGAKSMSYHRITAYDAVEAGILDADEVQDAKEQLPEQVFKELYEAEASDDEGNPFGNEAIQNCISLMSAREPAVWGWDLAKHYDFTVGHALDHDGNTCGWHRWQKPWEDTIRNITFYTGRTRAIIDSTGVGDPIVERLQSEGMHNVEAFMFTGRSKQKLMEGLVVAIQRREITFPDGPIVQELESFGYEYSRNGVRYSAPQGMHDDCVMALALAVHGKPSRTVTVRTPPRDRNVMSGQPGTRKAPRMKKEYVV